MTKLAKTFQNEQPIFNKVGTIAELVHMTPDELTRYNISLDTFRTRGNLHDEPDFLALSDS